MADYEKMKKAARLDCDNALKYYNKVAKDKNASASVRKNAESEIKRITKIKESIPK